MSFVDCHTQHALAKNSGVYSLDQVKSLVAIYGSDEIKQFYDACTRAIPLPSSSNKNGEYHSSSEQVVSFKASHNIAKDDLDGDPNRVGKFLISLIIQAFGQTVDEGCGTCSCTLCCPSGPYTHCRTLNITQGNERPDNVANPANTSTHSADYSRMIPKSVENICGNCYVMGREACEK